jgi:hypothetical protein
MLPELSFFCCSSCIAHPQLRRMIGSLDTLLAVRGGEWDDKFTSCTRMGARSQPSLRCPPHGNGALPIQLTKHVESPTDTQLEIEELCGAICAQGDGPPSVRLQASFRHAALPTSTWD